MPPDQNAISNYFDTPARAERLQLLLYLVRNAGEVIYLRAPSGAGKTLFAQRLFDTLSDQVAAVWVRGSEECDVAAAAVDQLGLPPDSARHWPDAVLEGLDGQELLLIVDDADRLGLKVVESLDLLHAHGGRLLLVGQGGLAETSGNWDLQFVDLPAFDAEQTTAFLRQQAGEQAARVTDDLAAGLHRASNGLPGPLLDALNGVLGGSGSRSAMRRTAATTSGRTGRPMWHWLAGGTLILLLASVLLFQEAFNRMFESDNQLAGRPIAVAVDPEPAASEVLTADATQNTGPDFAPHAGADAEAVVVPAETGPQAPEVVTVTPPPVEDAPATEQERAPEQQADTEEDPLDAVMRDALAAAGAGKSDPSKADVGAVDKALPAEVRPAAVSLPEDGQAKTEVVPETPAEATPLQDNKPPAEPSAVAAAAPDPEPESKSSVVADSVQQAPGEPPVEPVSEPVGAPVESREIPKAPPVVTAKPVVVVPAATAPSGGGAWLKNRDPGRYTLQLVGSRDRAAVRKFVRVHAVGDPYAIFERDLKGKPWYSLVAGDYPDRAAAIAARERLPKSLGRSGIWPRTFGSIQNLK